MRASREMEAFEQWLGSPLAEPLAAFLQQWGGQLVGQQCVVYDASELTERNECYETKVYCPGWITIGDDGGGRTIVVAPSLQPPDVFSVDHGVMSEDCFMRLAGSLGEWAQGGFPPEPGPNNSFKPTPLRGAA